MYPHALPNTHSTLISILMEYILIGEGVIMPCNETSDEEDPSAAVPRSIVEAAQRLHQVVGHYGRRSPDMASNGSTSPCEGCTESLVEIRVRPRGRIAATARRGPRACPLASFVKHPKVKHAKASS